MRRHCFRESPISMSNVSLPPPLFFYFLKMGVKFYFNTNFKFHLTLTWVPSSRSGWSAAALEETAEAVLKAESAEQFWS